MKRTPFYRSLWLLAVLLMFFGGMVQLTGCATHRPIKTSEASGHITKPAEPAAPCVEAAKGEPISINCVEGLPYLTINLKAVEFIQVEGRSKIPGTLIKEQPLILVGDFNPGWTNGDTGTNEGGVIRFALEKFSKHEGSHRLQVKVSGVNTWLFLEGLEKNLQMVTLSFENDWNESIAIGLWVWPDGRITSFKANPEGLDHITVRAGLMGPWKRVQTRTEPNARNTADGEPITAAVPASGTARSK